MSLHDDLLTAAAYLEGDGVTMEAAEADRIAGVFRSYATALCQQGGPTEELGTLFNLAMYGDRGNPEKMRREILRLLSLYAHAHAERDAKDAARYRWLRAKWHRIEAYTDHDSHALVMQVNEFGGTLADNERLDAAIDAAITSGGKTE